MSGERQAPTAPSITGRVSPMCPVRSVTYVTGRTRGRERAAPGTPKRHFSFA